MSLPDVVSRAQWLEARRRLLAEEKEATRRLDALNADRRRLPMVEVDKEYVFEGPAGQVTLSDLFGNSRQLIIQHVMLGPDWDQPCPGCSAALDELSAGLLDHLRNRETAFVLASRAPYEKIATVAKEHGWFAPWYSTHGSDFNYDYQVSLDADRGQAEYNYRAEPSLLGGNHVVQILSIDVAFEVFNPRLGYLKLTEQAELHLPCLSGARLRVILAAPGSRGPLE